ncbi:MAG TPA: DUF58 domain-containing protein [Thermoplasmata archaeon]|jgi:uncharacterized protein (DUF58 family)|nr:DUF58 domain-containing protein [Thermoplasmata archaeon]
MRTPFVAGLVGTSMVFVLGGFVYRSWQLVLLALPPLLFLAVGALAPPRAPRLVPERVVSRDRLEVGGSVRVEVTLRNAGPGLDLLEIVDARPAELVLERGTDRAVVALPPGDSFTLAYEVRALVKGEYAIGPVRVRALDPLGLGAEDAVVPSVARVHVAPALEDMRRARLAPRRTRPWFGQVSSRRPGIGTEFWAVREYAPGDEVRRINWKATARLGRPFTNEFEGERSGDVVIVLDARRESFVGSRTDNPVEHGVRAALGIAEHVLASRNRVGLIVQRNVLDRVLPAFGKKQLYRVLDALVHVRAGGEWPFAQVALILSRYYAPDALVVLISPLTDRTALEAVVGLTARGYDVVIVSPSPLEIERKLTRPSVAQETAYRVLRIERDNLLAQLRRIAHVVDWDPATPLALSLRRMATSARAR